MQDCDYAKAVTEVAGRERTCSFNCGAYCSRRDARNGGRQKSARGCPRKDGRPERRQGKGGKVDGRGAERECHEGGSRSMGYQVKVSVASRQGQACFLASPQFTSP